MNTDTLFRVYCGGKSLRQKYFPNQKEVNSTLFDRINGHRKSVKVYKPINITEIREQVLRVPKRTKNQYRDEMKNKSLVKQLRNKINSITKHSHKFNDLSEPQEEKELSIRNIRVKKNFSDADSLSLCSRPRQAKNKYKSVSVSRRTPLKRKYKASKEKTNHSVMKINPNDDCSMGSINHKSSKNGSRRYNSVSTNIKKHSKSRSSYHNELVSAESQAEIDKEITRQNIIRLINEIQARKESNSDKISTTTSGFTNSNKPHSKIYNSFSPNFSHSTRTSAFPVPNIRQAYLKPDHNKFPAWPSRLSAVLESVPAKHKKKREIEVINSDGILNHYLKK
ncbi:unnamed protein product [Moneuplotes crassus]|uniref:Uncharacterized protein n=1 Tax=Euplotes crassus TaxID=5936 RepID=A0AAD1UH23_EUPCR|nr:unnamed protein product [Moneuplotes crassus]